MNLDTLVSSVVHGNINAPSATVLIVLIIAIATVIVTYIRGH
jgi:hypothetical protein